MDAVTMTRATNLLAELREGLDDVLLLDDLQLIQRGENGQSEYVLHAEMVEALQWQGMVRVGTGALLFKVYGGYELGRDVKTRLFRERKKTGSIDVEGARACLVQIANLIRRSRELEKERRRLSKEYTEKLIEPYRRLFPNSGSDRLYLNMGTTPPTAHLTVDRLNADQLAQVISLLIGLGVLD